MSPQSQFDSMQHSAQSPPPSFRFSRPFHLAGWALLTTIVVAACNNEDADEAVEFGPSQLKITGAQNTDGVSFDRDDNEVELACDARLTVLLGPEDVTPGILKNWDLRPPGNCGEESTQCGFLRVRFLDSDDEVIRKDDQVSITPVFDLGNVNVEKIKRIEALLINGRNGRPYLQDGKEVSDRWKVKIVPPPEDCLVDGTGGTGTGGSVGSGGSDNLAGMGGLGGLSGLGGAQ